MSPIRQPRGTAFALRDPWPWPDFAALAREGEALGYAAVFLPEISGRDAFAALTGIAGDTSELLLGSGIVPMTSRAPALTAMGAATVHERSGGRCILGLGTGPAAPGALDRLREEVVALKRALRGETAAVAGRDIHLTLHLETPPPVWIAALGPKAVRLAGEVADGVLLNWCTPGRVERARREVAEGAERARRDPSDVTVAVYVRASLGSDAAAGILALKGAAGEYASFPAYARQFETLGLADDARAAAAAHSAGRPEDVPDHFVREVCLVGEPSLARGKLRALSQAGADLPVVYPVPAGGDPLGTVRSTLAALAPSEGP